MGTLLRTCTKHNTFTASQLGHGQKAVGNSENVFSLRGKWVTGKGLRQHKWEVGEIVRGARENISKQAVISRGGEEGEEFQGGSGSLRFYAWKTAVWVKSRNWEENVQIINSPVHEQQYCKFPPDSNHIPLVSSRAGLLHFLIKSKLIVVDFPLRFSVEKKAPQKRKQSDFFLNLTMSVLQELNSSSLLSSWNLWDSTLTDWLHPAETRRRRCCCSSARGA